VSTARVRMNFELDFRDVISGMGVNEDRPPEDDRPPSPKPQARDLKTGDVIPGIRCGILGLSEEVWTGS